MPSVTPPLRDPPLSALPSPGVALTTYFLAFLLQISSPTSEPLPSESWISTTSCAEWQASPLCPTMGPGPGWCACWRTRPARPRAPHPAPLHWSPSWWYCWWCWPSCVRRVPNTQHGGWINHLLDSCKAIQLLIYSWMIPYTKVPTSLELFLFFLDVRKVLAFHLFNYRLFSFFLFFFFHVLRWIVWTGPPAVVTRPQVGVLWSPGPSVLHKVGPGLRSVYTWQPSCTTPSIRGKRRLVWKQ